MLKVHADRFTDMLELWDIDFTFFSFSAVF